MKVYALCGEKGCCPVVEIGTEEVKIGEANNLCTLKRNEWETLKEKIRSGEIK